MTELCIQQITKTDIKALIGLIDSHILRLDVRCCGAARKEAKKVMLLANRIAGKKIYNTDFLTQNEFWFLKLIWAQSGHRLDDQIVRLSTLQTTCRKYARRFLKLGYAKLEILTGYHRLDNWDSRKEKDRLVITKLGSNKLHMRHRQ